MIKPTIGQVLWYRPALSDGHLASMRSQPLASMVVFVHDDRCVNLVVFTKFGESTSKIRVRLLQEGDANPSEHSEFCSWMPYQVRVAKAAQQSMFELEPKPEPALHSASAPIVDPPFTGH